MQNISYTKSFSGIRAEFGLCFSLGPLTLLYWLRGCDQQWCAKQPADGPWIHPFFYSEVFNEFLKQD